MLNKAALEVGEQRKIREVRLVEVTKIAINNVVNKYIGEVANRKTAEVLRCDVENAMRELHYRFQKQRLVSYPMSYNVFSITIDPGYALDIRMSYDGVTVELIELIETNRRLNVSP